MSTSDQSNDTMANGQYRALLGIDTLPGVVSVYDMQMSTKEDKPLIVPVTKLIKKIKGSDQKTLTQIFGQQVINLSSNESEVDEDFLPKKKERLASSRSKKL